MPVWHLPRRVAGFFLRDRALFMRYVSVGAISALIEFTLFNLAYAGFGWPLLRANVSALAVALTVNFLAHRGWTFRVAGSALGQLRYYALMQGVSAVLNNILMYVMVDGLQWNAPIAKVLQIGIVFVWNFSFSRLVVFRGGRVS